MVTYVMGDVHGQVNAFNALLLKAKFNGEVDHLYLVGDYVDGYMSDGPKLILTLIDLMERFPGHIHPVMGNHDDMMLRSLDIIDKMNSTSTDDTQEIPDTRIIETWFYNGGDYTYSLYRDRTAEEQEKIKHFLRNLPLQLDFKIGEQKYVVVHADPIVPGTSEEDARDIALWGKFKRARTTDDIENKLRAVEPDTIVISGHTVTTHYADTPNKHEAQIINLIDRGRVLIDTGAKLLQYSDRYRLRVVGYEAPISTRGHKSYPEYAEYSISAKELNV